MTNRYSFQLKWSDLDPNIHMRHSSYYDYAAQARVNFLADHHFTLKEMAIHQVFPVLFREEALFHKEIGFNEIFHIELELIKSSEDFRKWGIVNTFYKNSGDKAATLTVEGGWMDAKTRKISRPPDLLFHAFEAMPRHKDFMVI